MYNFVLAMALWLIVIFVWCSKDIESQWGVSPRICLSHRHPATNNCHQTFKT